MQTILYAGRMIISAKSGHNLTQVPHISMQSIEFLNYRHILRLKKQLAGFFRWNIIFEVKKKYEKYEKIP
jgi:hypothetical protein